MTEGLNATLNPAIIVLDACNTFGDFEQVEGRILRKYGSPYETKRVKAVYQFLTRVDEEIVNSYFKPASIPSIIRTPVVRMGQKVETMVDTFEAQKSRENILGFTFSEYMFASSSFQYASPDTIAWNKIVRERKNLETFEKSIKYGIQASDLTESVSCILEDSFDSSEEDLKFINLNLSGNENQDLFFDCKTKERAMTIIETEKKIANYTEAQQSEILSFVKNVIDERSKQYKSSMATLIDVFNKKKEEESPKIDNPDFFEKLYQETFLSIDEKTKIATFAMFISTSINDKTNPKIEQLLQLLNNNKSLNISEIQSTRFFTPQVEQFKNYMNRKIREANTLNQTQASKIEFNNPISPPPPEEVKPTISSLEKGEHEQDSPPEESISTIISKSTPFIQNGTQVKDGSQNLAFITDDGKIIDQKGRQLILNRNGNVRLTNGKFLTQQKPIPRMENNKLLPPAGSTRVYNTITGLNTNEPSARINVNGTEYNVNTAKDLLEFLNKNRPQEPRDFKMNPLSPEDIQQLKDFVKPFTGGKSKKKNKKYIKNKTHKNK
jgi:hypothetical protein